MEQKTPTFREGLPWQGWGVPLGTGSWRQGPSELLCPLGKSKEKEVSTPSDPKQQCGNSIWVTASFQGLVEPLWGKALWFLRPSPSMGSAEGSWISELPTRMPLGQLVTCREAGQGAPPLPQVRRSGLTRILM